MSKRGPITKLKGNNKITIHEKLNTCRLCLIDRAVHNIFQENLIVFDEILSYCKLQPFKNDGLPEHVCNICLKASERVVKFMKQCEENDRQLRKNLNLAIEISIPAVKMEPKELKEEPDDSGEYDEDFTFDPGDIEDSCNKDILLDTHDENNIHLKQIKLEKNESSDEKETTPPLGGKQTESIHENKLKRPETKRRAKRKRNSDKTSKLCPICGKTFGHSNTYRHHIKLHSGERFPCTFPACQKTFRTKAQMDQHHKLHFPSQLSPCQICGKSFNSKYLKHHMSVYHERKQKTSCEICNKILNTATSYNVHMQVHRGEKRYECDICKRKFTQKCVLMIHIRTHTGEKPYSCSFCGNSFTTTKSMQRHRRLHTGERPYICPVCTKGFMQSSNLKSHVRNNHKDFNLKDLKKLNEQ